LGRELELVIGEGPARCWNSIAKRIEQRHQEAHQAFRIARKSVKKDGYVESSPLAQTKDRHIGNLSDRNIGWDPGEGPTKGIREWIEKQQFWWREEAKKLLGKFPRKGWSEKLWNWTERNRAYHCTYFEIQFIKYPWPGDQGDLTFDPRTVQKNQEAIAEMIATNPVFTMKFKWDLGE
jgi:hypothetical protein